MTADGGGGNQTSPAASGHTYLPAQLEKQFIEWDKLFVESGRQALELIDRIDASE